MTEVRRRAATLLAASAAVAALLAPVDSRGAAAPEGIHVAFGADPATEATIVWTTAGFVDPGTVVEYSAGGTSLDQTRNGSSREAPGSGYPAGAVIVHEVALSSLPPGAEIFYRVGAPGAWSSVRSFATAPAHGDAFSFIAYGDQDTNANSVRVNDAVLAADPDFVLVAGDLSYAQPGTPTFPEWPKWDDWFEIIEPLASTRALMPAVGNHECETVGCTSSFRARFALPGDEIYYSFDYGNAHFLVFLSDRNTWIQERQLALALAFAETDLAEAAARKRAGEIDWIFVVQHHPLYGSQGSDVDILVERWYNPALIALEEGLLHANEVDVLIAGHNHHYQRTKPMVYGVPTTDERTTYVDPDGFIQVITGGAGRGLSSIASTRPLNQWDAANARRFHYTSFEVDGKSLTFRAVATDVPGGELLDTFTITRT